MPVILRSEIQRRAKGVLNLLNSSHTIAPTEFDPDSFSFKDAEPETLVAYAKYRLGNLPRSTVETAFQYAGVCGLLLRAGLLTRKELKELGH